MEIFPKYIKEFDEVSETFVYISSIPMLWKDYRLAWAPTNYAGIDTVTVPVTQVRTLELFLASPATKEMYILQPWNQVRIENDGKVSIVQAILVESSCSVNVKFYPFDTQSFDTFFMSLVYRFYEVTVIKGNHGIHFGVYTENSLWNITFRQTCTLNNTCWRRNADTFDVEVDTQVTVCHGQCAYADYVVRQFEHAGP